MRARPTPDPGQPTGRVPSVGCAVPATEIATRRSIALTAAAEDVCTTTETYVRAIDRYGDVLDASAPTVGDVRETGSDLAAPAQDVQVAVDELDASRQEVDGDGQEQCNQHVGLLGPWSRSPPGRVACRPVLHRLGAGGGRRIIRRE